MTTPVIPDEAVRLVVENAKWARHASMQGAPEEMCDRAIRVALFAAAPLILAANADPAQPVTDVSGNEWIAVTRAGWEAAVAVISAVLYGVVHPMGDSLTQEDAARLVDAFESTVTGPASIEYIASAIGYTKPRVISSAADIRALGEAVRDGSSARVLLVDRHGQMWRMAATSPGLGPLEVWLTDADTDGRTIRVRVDREVPDSLIAGHGPWRVVWSRGVEL